jgi:hypothetical protein
LSENAELTRRRLLELGLLSAGGLAVAPLRDVAVAATGPRWPRAALGPTQARRIDPRQFMPASQLRTWQHELDRLGLRATGSRAQDRYIDDLHDRLARAGVRSLRREPVPIRRWSARRWSLTALGGPEPGRVPIAAYIPYSGRTPPAGVTAPLARVEPGAVLAPGSLRGRIAVFDVPATSLPYSAFAAITYPGTILDPHHQLAPAAIYRRPWLAIADLIKLLDGLRATGVVGAVGILDLPADAAHGSYFPYDGHIRAVPGLFVDRETGARVKRLAAAGARARLVLTADVERVTTYNLVGLIPGASDELMLLHSHTDGPNALEDNGPDAIVAISQYLTRLPHRARPRTIMVLLTTGHFHGGIGVETFVTRHRHGTLRRTAGAVTLEHLGAREWLAGARRSRLSGHPEPGVVFAPESSPLVDAAFGALRAAGAAPGSVLRPFVRNARSRDGNGWPAEGTQLWTDGAIPTANYITGPTYLLNWGIPTADKIDLARMRAEAIAFTGMVLALARVPPARLRRLDLRVGG